MALARFALGVALTALALPAAAQTAPVVQTAEGKVEGKRANGVSAFLGIPYGADTGGQNRFRAPKPAAPWTGVREATAFGDRCPQPPLNKPGALILFSDLPVSENCLSANVWTASTKGKRPVMVWIHGGGFGFGSSADKYYDGTALAGKEGVVVVSINHRLNGFGYLNLGPEAHGDFDQNVGQLDIVQALKWVRENIARFGGDPGNVTLFGQSGGAGKISVLLAMPAAHGLFQKAIIESGSDVHTNDVAASLGERDKVLAAFNLKPDEILKLRDMPMQALIDGFTKAGILLYHPVMDGTVLPTQPYDPVANPVSANIPLLLGTAHDEATSVLANNPIWPAMTDAQLPVMVGGLLTGPVDAAEGIALYKAHSPQDKAMHLFSSMMTDQMFTVNAMQMAERKSAQPAPVYLYRVDWHSPMRGGVLRSPHGVDLPFVFDTVAETEELVGRGPSQDRMTKLMRSTFAAFARTGNPNVKGSGYPLWPTYNARTRAVFVFNDPPSVIHNPDADLRAFWEKVAARKQADRK
jgi:para-nitrobenzyl esterase